MSLLNKTPVLQVQDYFPGSPYDGQKFLHAIAGRRIEYIYDALIGIWRPLNALGAIDVYVDATDGTDDLDHGYGVDAAAFSSIQYAVDMLPNQGATRNNQFTIHINDEIYAEDVYVGLRNNCNIDFIGTLTTISNLVATGGLQGAAPATPARVDGAFVVGAHDGLLIYFTSGANNGEYRIIGMTTAGSLYLVGNPLPAAPINGDTYTIYDWGTSIRTFYTYYCNFVRNYNICFDNATPHPAGAAVFSSFESRGNDFRCKYRTTGAISAAIVAGAFRGIYTSFFECTSLGGARALDVFGCAAVEVGGCKLLGGGLGAGSIGIRIQSEGDCEFGGAATGGKGMNEISAFGIGCYLVNNSVLSTWTPTINHFIHGNVVQGINSSRNSSVFNTASVTYGVDLSGAADVNGADEIAQAASFSYID